MDYHFPILRCPRGNQMVVLVPELMFTDRDEAARIDNGGFYQMPGLVRWHLTLASEWRPTGEVLTAPEGKAARQTVRASYPCDSMCGARVPVALLAGPDFDAAPVATAVKED